MDFAQISRIAFNAIENVVTDAVHDATMTYQTQGAYDVDAGEYALTPVTLTGRLCVETETPVQSIFPDYEIGPGDELLFLEGFNAIPKDGWEIDVTGKTWVVKRSQDILSAGTGAYVVARAKP